MVGIPLVLTPATNLAVTLSLGIRVLFATATRSIFRDCVPKGAQGRYFRAPTAVHRRTKKAKPAIAKLVTLLARDGREGLSKPLVGRTRRLVGSAL